MKDAETLVKEITSKFFESHPELNFTQLDPVTQLVINENKIYAHIAIRFTVLMMQEDELLTSKKDAQK